MLIFLENLCRNVKISRSGYQLTKNGFWPLDYTGIMYIAEIRSDLLQNCLIKWQLRTKTNEMLSSSLNFTDKVDCNFNEMKLLTTCRKSNNKLEFQINGEGRHYFQFNESKLSFLISTKKSEEEVCFEQIITTKSEFFKLFDLKFVSFLNKSFLLNSMK